MRYYYHYNLGRMQSDACNKVDRLHGKATVCCHNFARVQKYYLNHFKILSIASKTSFKFNDYEVMKLYGGWKYQAFLYIIP